MRNHSTETNKKINSTWHKITKNFPEQLVESYAKSTDNFKTSDLGYCSTLRHHFDGGDPLEDWMVAEDEVGYILSVEQENSNS